MAPQKPFRLYFYICDAVLFNDPTIELENFIDFENREDLCEQVKFILKDTSDISGYVKEAESNQTFDQLCTKIATSLDREYKIDSIYENKEKKLYSIEFKFGLSQKQ